MVDFLKTYLALSPAGRNFKAACPFHKEKSPSFIASPDRQIWHCFGCGAGGDAIAFLMRYENLEFVEALKVLADKLGLDFQRQGSSDQKQYDRLYKINESAKDYFKANLTNSSAGKVYLRERGLKDETVEEFELGLASDAVDGLTRHLTKQGYNIAEIEKAGLIFKTKRGTYMDRFRSRLMFPLSNSFGKVVAFTGRISPSYEGADVGKYVNSPETSIYNKSKLLFGLHKSKNIIRDSDAVVVVEGQMDLLMSWQDGIKNIVATSGTAVTPDHLKLLRRLTGNLMIGFDSDEAGQMAAERTIDLAQRADFLVRVVGLSSKDPADIVKEQPGQMIKLISSANSAMEYYMARYLRSDVDAGTHKNNLRLMLAKIKNIYSPVDRSHWLKELSTKTNIDEKFLFEEMSLIKSDAKGEAATAAGGGDKQSLSRSEIIAQRLLSLVVADNSLGDQLQPSRKYLPDGYSKVLDYLLKPDPASASGVIDLVNLVSLRSSLAFSEDKAKLVDEFTELLKQLKIEHLRDKRQTLFVLIKNTEHSGDENELAKALQEFDEVTKEMQNI